MKAVYFIQAGSNGPVKIGASNDPATRLTGLQTSHYEQLRILGLAERGRSESDIHASLGEHRLAGEWFAPAPEVLAAVAHPWTHVERILSVVDQIANTAAQTARAVRKGRFEDAATGLLAIAAGCSNGLSEIGVTELEVSDRLVTLFRQAAAESVAVELERVAS